jgi:hypothetical protein
MKLPYLRTRKYKNNAGVTWIGYYYEPPRGSGGVPGVIPKGRPLPDELRPIHPTGAADTIGDFAEALRVLESLSPT